MIKVGNELSASGERVIAIGPTQFNVALDAILTIRPPKGLDWAPEFHPFCVFNFTSQSYESTFAGEATNREWFSTIYDAMNEFEKRIGI